MSAVLCAGGLLSLVSLTDTVVSLGVVIALLGACAALMVIPTVGVISRTVEFQNRSRVNGLISSGTAYGQFAAGIIAPLILSSHDWKSVWLVIGLGSLGISLSGLVGLRLLAPMAFVRKVTTHGMPPSQKSAQKLRIDRTTLTLWVLLAASGMACGPWQNYLATYLREEHGYTIGLVGQLWSLIGFLGLFSGFLIGMLADRVGIRTALSMSYLLVGLSALLVAAHANVAMLQAAAFLFGLSFFAVYGLVPAYITKTVTPDHTTAIFAGANICLGLGTALGNYVAGYIPNWSESLQQVYVCISIVAVIAALLTFTLQDERGE